MELTPVTIWNLPHRYTIRQLIYAVQHARTHPDDRYMTAEWPQSYLTAAEFLRWFRRCLQRKINRTMSRPYGRKDGGDGYLSDWERAALQTARRVNTPRLIVKSSARWIRCFSRSRNSKGTSGSRRRRPQLRVVLVAYALLSLLTPDPPPAMLTTPASSCAATTGGETLAPLGHRRLFLGRARPPVAGPEPSPSLRQAIKPDLSECRGRSHAQPQDLHLSALRQGRPRGLDNCNGSAKGEHAVMLYEFDDEERATLEGRPLDPQNPGLSKPVPPFPAGVPGEPCSPERAAYVEAPTRFARERPEVAETIRGAGSIPNFGGGYPLPSRDQLHETNAEADKARDLLAERDRLQAEVGRLRASNTVLIAAVNQRTIESRRWFSAAVERKAEIVHLQEVVQRAKEQRDALADAAAALLEGRDGMEVVAFIPVVWNGAPGSARQEAANTVGAEQLRAALRKAGRL